MYFLLSFYGIVFELLNRSIECWTSTFFSKLYASFLGYHNIFLKIFRMQPILNLQYSLIFFFNRCYFNTTVVMPKHLQAKNVEGLNILCMHMNKWGDELRFLKRLKYRKHQHFLRLLIWDTFEMCPSLYACQQTIY